METICNDLEKIITTLPVRLNALNPEQLEAKKNPEKWSGKEILGHLIDSATNNLHRFVRGQYEEKPHIVYDQDKWVSLQNYQAIPLTQVIKLWEGANYQIVNVLRNMDESMWNRECNTGKNGEELYTLMWMADDYVKHLNHHIKQIFNAN
jgi:hypothetical protein